MATSEIPFAQPPNTTSSETAVGPVDSYTSQKEACLKEMQKLNDKCGCVTVCLSEKVDEVLMKELQDKGFVIKYYLSYDQKKDNPYICRLRIINPHCQDPATAFIDSLEENLASLGFNKNNTQAEDSLKKMFNGFFMM